MKLAAIPFFLFIAGLSRAQGPQIAIYAFQDIGGSGAQQAGQKLYDRMLGHLIESQAYQVNDRQYLEKIWLNDPKTAGRPLDVTAAIQAGKLGNLSAIVAGDITSFTFNPRSTEDSSGFYGTVTVAATAKLINTDTGVYITAPTASQSARGIVQLKPKPAPQQRPCTVVFGHQICPPLPSSSGSSDKPVETKTMEQLVDEAIEGCAKTLADALVASAKSVPPMAAKPVSTTQPADTTRNPIPAATVMAVAQGVTQINLGSSAGLKVGQALKVSRMGNLPSNDPVTGKPMTGKLAVCTLTLGEVNPGNSRGFCQGGVPAPGDFAEPQ